MTAKKSRGCSCWRRSTNWTGLMAAASVLSDVLSNYCKQKWHVQKTQTLTGIQEEISGSISRPQQAVFYVRNTASTDRFSLSQACVWPVSSRKIALSN